jgi:hypothetical protein
VQPKESEWLAAPMKEQTVWVQGQEVPSLGCFRLKPGVVQVPDGLHTYGQLGLLCGFQAQNETRLAVIDLDEAEIMHQRNAGIVLRGVVLPSAKMGLTPHMMDVMAQKWPNLNKNLVFVYNADYGNPDGFSLGDAAPIILWVALGLSLPFWAYLIAASFWKKRDAWLLEQFRGALWQAGAAQGLMPAPALTR